MAEFQYVVRQLIRLCETQTDCDKCPVDKVGCCGNVAALKQSELIEKSVILWAEENPEPVYPTWWSWLINEGVIEKGSTYTGAFDQLKTKSIPADIAQKLGIEPR